MVEEKASPAAEPGTAARSPRRPGRIRTGFRRHGLTRRPGDLRKALQRRGLRFTDGNEVQLFDCGRAAFPVMLEAIRKAERFVHLETYILRDDEIGHQFLQALEERAAAGIEVRVLFDAIGSHQLDPFSLEPLKERGGQVVVFNPLRLFYPNWTPRRRDHRKLLIVDGARAFVGGLNIGDEYDRPPVDRGEEKGWRDTHASTRGPAVRALGAVFLESWYRAGGPDLEWNRFLGDALPEEGIVRCSVLADGPVYVRRSMRDLLVSALDGTEQTARLTSPYFAPDGRVLDALGKAAERGVRVELLLAGQTDHPMLRRGARSTVERLLKRGVHIHEYEAAMLHAKTAVFDQRVAIVGTSNLDRQSFRHNYEVNLVSVGAEVPRALDALFESDLVQSKEVTLAGLAQRSAWARLIDRGAAWIMKRFL